jgi:hypothetical protein
VQTSQPGDHEGAGPLNDSEAKGVLACPDGVVRIYCHGELVAHCYDCKKTYISGTYPEGDNDHHIEWDCWRIGELRWTHKAALMFLQGSSMQQLVVPSLLLRAHPTPPYDPRPGALDVVIAEIYVAPDPPLDHRTMFGLLAPDAIRLSPQGT